MCIANPTTPAPSPSSPPTPDAECLLPSPSPIDDFNAQLALAKIKALEALLRICENADGAASPEEIRRAASAILRCTPLRDPTAVAAASPVRTPVPPTSARGGRCSSTSATFPPRPLSPTERRLLDDYYARHPRQHHPTAAAPASSRPTAPVPPDPEHDTPDPRITAPAQTALALADAASIESSDADAADAPPATADAPADDDAPTRDAFCTPFTLDALRLRGFAEVFASADTRHPLAAPA